MKPTPPSALRLLALLAGLLTALAGCTGLEQQRIRELLNEKGFGSRADGVATWENYIAGGDGIQFYLDPVVVSQPGMEQLALLAQKQPIGIDGTIHVPYIGSVPVLGLTEREAASLVEAQLQPLFPRDPIALTARVDDRGKAYYVWGEAERKGRIPFLKADVTVIEALALSSPTQLANLGRVRLIRPDAQNPLTVEINMREMVLTGNTTYNLKLQDNDFLYVPPTFFGMLTRFVEKLLEPVAVIVRALFGVASVRASYDYLTGDTNRIGNRFFFGF